MRWNARVPMPDIDASYKQGPAHGLWLRFCLVIRNVAHPNLIMQVTLGCQANHISTLSAASACMVRVLDCLTNGIPDILH